jgi:hypothetical protein
LNFFFSQLFEQYDIISKTVRKHDEELAVFYQISKEETEKRSSDKIIFDSIVNEAKDFMNGLQRDTKYKNYHKE